jgi:anthranilate phosphoribosyltransferase
MLRSLSALIQAGHDLDSSQVLPAVDALTSESVPAEEKADFLSALGRKGESPAEITAFAAELRRRSIPLPINPANFPNGILDVCGTGGDKLNTFNISTSVALLCAAAGVTVAKHGNRAITSQSGSADVLETLGIPVDLSPQDAASSLQSHRFAFLFAQHFHPAFRHISPARQICAKRGDRTLFNYLGPLLNPALPTFQLLGVSRPELTQPLAHTLQQLGVRRAMVVSGEVPGGAFLDELSTIGPNSIAEFYQDRGFSSSVWLPSDFPLLPASLADLAGGDRHTNAVIIENLFRGSDTSPRRDALLLNASAALFVAGACRSMVDGWDLAADTLRSGLAWNLVLQLRAHR